MTSEDLLARLKKVPDEPGSYIFKDKRGSILYVGKARSLKKRMLSYFQKSHQDSAKIAILVDKIADFDFFVTKNEMEALILEFNLIKQHRPPFNAELKDDKSYPYLAITYGEEFPRIYVTRELHRKGTRYFGPYTKVYSLRKTLDTLRNIFPIRTYTKTRPIRPSRRPYFDYHIKWGIAAGSEAVDSRVYRRIIDNVIAFLEGRDKSIICELDKEMKKAAREEDFEKAARLRDRIEAATNLLEGQRVVMPTRQDKDVIGLVEEEKETYVRILFIRSGRLIGSRGYVLEKDQVEEDVLTAFVKKFYSDEKNIPPEILLPQKINDSWVIEGWLSEKKGRKIRLTTPQRGLKKDLVEMAATNAKYTYQSYKLKVRQQLEETLFLLNELKRDLNLPLVPQRIEAFDISTLQGNETVGSMVVFEGARPKRGDYRRFRVRRLSGQDDFGAMAEVLKRRLKYLVEPIPEERFASQPDLIVVDGGKPQLSAALQALSDTGIKNIPVIALAKREEQVFEPGKKGPLELDLDSPSLNLLRHLRDEAHRFALAYHIHLRGKKMLGMGK